MLRKFSFAFLSLSFAACAATDNDSRPDSGVAVTGTETADSPATESATDAGNPEGARPALGFMPGYESVEDGVAVEMVTEGGPAAKAGLLAGDQIIELHGAKVLDINDYVTVLSGLRIGSPVEVKVMRDGKAKKMTVVVGER